MSRRGGAALVAVALLAVCSSGAPAAAQNAESLERRALRILRDVPLVDGHNDLPWQYRTRVSNHIDRIDLASDTRGLEPPLHTDLPRLRRGGMGAQLWSVYVPADVAAAARVQLEQIDVALRMIDAYPDAFELALTADDVERIHGSGRIASLLGMEGGHVIENSLGALRVFYRAGARYLTLTHSRTLDWADSASDEARHGGLTPFGVEVVREMNRLGMLVDLSHVSPETMHDALDAAEAPVIFSHSSARALCDHPRNVPDDVLERLPRNGGVVMVTFVPGFVSPAVRARNQRLDAERRRLRRALGGDEPKVKRALAQWGVEHPAPRATLAEVADHVEHVRRLAGPDHVGLGSDFDGIRSVPEGLEDVSRYPALLAELLRRGWTDGEIAALAGRNALRVLRAAEETARRLQASRPASGALIEELDGRPVRGR